MSRGCWVSSRDLIHILRTTRLSSLASGAGSGAGAVAGTERPIIDDPIFPLLLEEFPLRLTSWLALVECIPLPPSAPINSECSPCSSTCVSVLAPIDPTSGTQSDEAERRKSLRVARRSMAGVMSSWLELPLLSALTLVDAGSIKRFTDSERPRVYRCRGAGGTNLGAPLGKCYCSCPQTRQ
jgi:hypothetical protein